MKKNVILLCVIMLLLTGCSGKKQDEVPTAVDTIVQYTEASIEESGNIIAGRGVSKVNDIFKEREMRLTPPGTISGTDIRLANPELVSFNIKASTKIGDICMSVGFSRGV